MSIHELKNTKRVTKTSISLFLTKLATVLSEDKPDKAEVKVILTLVKEQRNKVLAFIDNLGHVLRACRMGN